jgi:hypothetical protein
VNREPVLSRISQNARKGPVPERKWAPDVVEQRSCLIEEAEEEERRALAWCRENNCKWEDESFPADKRSIVKHCISYVFFLFNDLVLLIFQIRNKTSLLKNYDHWERLTERSSRPSLFVGGSGSGDVIQGEVRCFAWLCISHVKLVTTEKKQVGDCWFLGALAMCATRQNDLLYPLFVSAHPEFGFFQIRFFLDAAWRVVSVDDRIPVKRSGGSIFAHCKNEDEYWVALVEKVSCVLVVLLFFS